MKSHALSRPASFRRRALVLVGSIEALVVVLACNPTAFATSGTWSATAATADWNTTANWSGAAFPNGTGDTATFSNALSGTIGSVANPITLSANVTVQNIVFTGSAGAFNIGAVGGASTIALRGTGSPGFGNSISIAASGTNAEVINANLLFSAPSSTVIGYSFLNNSTTTAATLTLTGTLAANTATNRNTAISFDGSNTGNNTYSGIITSTLASGGVSNIVIKKEGVGRWILSGANVLTGGNMTSTSGTLGIQVNAGVLSAQNNAALGGTGAGTANSLNTWINANGTLELANAITLNNEVSLNLNSGGTIRSSGSNTTNGRINLSAAAAVSATLSTVNAADVFTIGNGTSDFTGGVADTVVHIAGPGTVVIATASTGYLGSVSIDAGALRNGSATNGLGIAGVVAFGLNSTGKLQLGSNLGLTGLTANAGSLTAGTVETGAVGTQTLTMTVAGTNSFGGVLQNGTGILALTKAGVGTLTLAGNANTYSGATAISNGTLLATNTSGSATGTSTVAVNNTGTLGGTGTVSGTVSVASGGTIAPGTTGVGTLTVGGLTLAAGSMLNYDITNTSTLDQITVANNNGLTINGGQVNINGGASPFTANGVYNLIAYTGTIGGTGTGALSVNGNNKNLATNTYGFGTAGGFVTLTIASSGAAPVYWNVDAAGAWSTGGNWVGNTAPNAIGAFAAFGGGGTAITAPRTVTVDAPFTAGTVSFNNATNAFTLAAGAGANITLDNGASGSFVTDSAGSHTIQAPLTLTTNGATFTVTGGGDTLTASGAIGGSGTGLVKGGVGTLALTGTNTYTGGTLISAGKVQINSADSLGDVTGTATLNNATLEATATIATARNINLGHTGSTIQVDTGSAYTVNGIVGDGANPGTLNKTGAGTLALTGINTYTGGVSVTGGTLSVSANDGLGLAATGAGISLNGGTLATTASFGLFNGGAGTNDRTITLGAGGGTLAPAVGVTLTVTGAVTGAGRLTKTDAGQVTIQNAAVGQNTFGGGTLISAGRIAFADANANAQGLGTGSVTLDGGTLQLFSLGASSTDAGTFPNNVVVDNGFTGTLITMGRGTIAGNLTGSGTFNYQTNYVRAQVTGNWSAFTGQINVTPNTNGGDFRLNNLNGFGTAKINLANGVNMSVLTNFGAGGATLAVGELSGGTTSFLGGGPTPGRLLTWVVGGANTNAQFDGTIRDGGTTGSGIGNTAITKVGTQTWILTGSNTYTGLTTVSNGALQIGSGGTTGTLGTGVVTDNATLVFNRSDAVSVGNGITGTGSLVQLGAGSVTLTGTVSVASVLLRLGTTVIDGLNSATVTATNFLSVGNQSTDNATLTVQGSGVLIVNTGAGDLNVSDIGGSTGVLNVTGGNVIAGNLWVGKNFDNNLVTGGTGTVNQSGGVVNVTSATGLVFAQNTASVGTYNLSGGTLLAQKVSKDIGTSATFNFNGGTLRSTAANANFMSGLTTANVQLGGVLIDDGGFAITIAQPLLHDAALGAAADGGLGKSGAGTLALTGVNTYTGNTTLAGGVLNVGVAETAGTSGPLGNQAANAAGTIVFGGGTLQYSAANQFDYSGRFSTAAGQALSVDTNGQAVSFGTVLSSAGGTLTKLGAGALTLTAANSYDGATTVSGGTLGITNGSALGTAAAGTTVASGATLALSGGIAVGAEAVSVNGTGVGGNGAIRSTAGSNSLAGAVTLAGSSTVQVDAGGLTLSGAINGGANALTKTGGGLLTISGTQTYATLNANAGVTNVNSALGTGTSTLNANSTVNISTSQTLAALNIGAGATVTFGNGLPFAGGPEKLAGLGGGAAVVPEPGSVGLLLVGAAGLLARRRRG